MTGSRFLTDEDDLTATIGQNVTGSRFLSNDSEVSLADLRDKLAGVPAAAVDAALKQLVRQPDVVLIPETDQSSLNPRDRQAAVRIGGEYKHLLAIEGR